MVVQLGLSFEVSPKAPAGSATSQRPIHVTQIFPDQFGPNPLTRKSGFDTRNFYNASQLSDVVDLPPIAPPCIQELPDGLNSSNVGRCTVMLTCFDSSACGSDIYVWICVI